MKLTPLQKKIWYIIAFAIGIISLFLFFKGLYLWAGIGFITMGVIFTCIKIQGGELNMVIGLSPILFHFGLMKWVVVWSIIIVLVGLYDFLIIFEIRKDLKGIGKEKDRKAFIESFREEELVHVLFTKLIKCFGFNKSQRD